MCDISFQLSQASRHSQFLTTCSIHNCGIKNNAHMRLPQLHGLIKDWGCFVNARKQGVCICLCLYTLGFNVLLCSFVVLRLATELPGVIFFPSAMLERFSCAKK